MGAKQTRFVLEMTVLYVNLTALRDDQLANKTLFPGMSVKFVCLFVFSQEIST